MSETSSGVEIKQEQIDTSLGPWWGLFAIFAIGFPLFFLFRPPLPEKLVLLPSFELVDQHGTQTENTCSGTPLL